MKEISSVLDFSAAFGDDVGFFEASVIGMEIRFMDLSLYRGMDRAQPEGGRLFVCYSRSELSEGRK